MGGSSTPGGDFFYAGRPTTTMRSGTFVVVFSVGYG